MNKLLITAAAAFIALNAMLAGAAEAGFNLRLKAPAGFATVEKAGCGGGRGYFRSYRKHAFRSGRRSKPKVYAARKPSKPVSVAKVEPKAPAAPAVETASAEVEVQNSSITTAEGDAAQTAEAKPASVKAAEPKVAAAEDIGCKQFFPSVGMTLSVPCEKAQ
jgi:hypothetical protein